MPHSSESLQAAFKYLFASEVVALKQLAQSLPDDPKVLNIGSGSGTSSLAFLESRPDLFLFCVDIEDKDSPLGSLYSERQVLEQAGFMLGFGGNFAQICCDSKELARRWSEANSVWDLPVVLLDMVFVDGDHSYRGAKGDILAWLPNIKEGGIIAVHDYDKKRMYKDGPIENAPHPLPWPGVDRAVRKFLCPFFEIVLHVETLISFRVTGEGYRRLLSESKYV